MIQRQFGNVLIETFIIFLGQVITLTYKLSGVGLIEILINDVDYNFLCYFFGRLSRSRQYCCS